MRTSAASICINIASAIGLILSVRAVLLSWPYVSTVLLFHCTVTYVLVRPKHKSTGSKDCDRSRQMALVFLVSNLGHIWLNNVSLLENSVGMYELLKACTLVCIMALEYVLYRFVDTRYAQITVAVLLCLQVLCSTYDTGTTPLGLVAGLLGSACGAVSKVMVRYYTKEFDRSSGELLASVMPLTMGTLLVIVWRSPPAPIPLETVGYLVLSCALAAAFNVTAFSLCDTIGGSKYFMLSPLKTLLLVTIANSWGSWLRVVGICGSVACSVAYYKVALPTDAKYGRLTPELLPSRKQCASGLGVLAIVGIAVYSLDRPRAAAAGSTSEPWAISCCVRDESPYLHEWLSHHVTLGASRIYLYDNNINASESNATRAIATRFPEVVTHIPWHMYDDVYELPWLPVRVSGSSVLGPFAAKYGLTRLQFAHADAIPRARAEGIIWLQKIDADEFLMPQSSTVAQYYASQRCGVRVPRYDFGSSGHDKKPRASVRQSYTMRECVPSNYKEVGRVSDIDGSPSSHRWSYSMRCRASDGDTADMVIFHYITKSKQEYMKRKVTDTRYPKGNVDLERKYQLEQQHTNCTQDNRASSL